MLGSHLPEGTLEDVAAALRLTPAVGTDAALILTRREALGNGAVELVYDVA